LFCSFESFELEAKFSEIKYEIRTIKLLNIILIEFGGFLVIMSEGVSSSEVSDDSFVIVSFLICFLIGYCCFFRLVYFGHRITVYFEILKGRHSLDNFKVALRVSFSAF
jgi:hypothetical protein